MWLASMLNTHKTRNSRSRRPRPAGQRLCAEGLERRNLLSVTVVAQQLSAVENAPLTISQNQLLAGDADRDVALAASSPTQPANATLVANADGTFTFTPNANFSGSTSFNYTVGAAVAQTSLTSGNTSNDLFGGSVAISDNGDEAVVGAPNETVDGHANQGAAFLFMRSGTAWMEQTEFTASDGAANDFFGAAVAISGDTVVVGAPNHTVNGHADEGTAYAFSPGKIRNSWSQAELTSGGGGAGDELGSSVAISGNTAVVGAVFYNVGLTPNPQGAAVVFVASGNVISGITWTEQPLLVANDGAANDLFGNAVAVSGNTVVVGAPNHTVNGHADEGAAYVFALSGTLASQQAELTSADGGTDDLFGQSVALSGNAAMIGAPQHTANGHVNQGVAYLFTYAKHTLLGAPSWSQQAEATSADGGAGDKFGSSVAIGDDVVVGAPKHSNGGSSPGAAYLFVEVPSSVAFGQTSLNQQGEVTAAGVADAQFGASVAVSGDTALLGAPSLTAAGAAYVQELGVAATATATVNVTPPPPPTPPTANPCTFVLGGGTSDSGSGPTNVLANDTSPDGKTLTATLVTSTTHGTLTLNPDGSFSYMPDASFQGIDRFSYQASEGATNSNTSTVTLLSYHASLVDKLYHQVLHRSAEDSGLTYWTSQLDGGASLDVVAQGIFNSSERLDPLVTQFYEKYLSRGTDPAGLMYWVTNWQTTGDPQDVVLGILDAPEFFDDAGDTNTGFVTLLYQRVLGRAPETAGLQYWTEQLNSGGSRAQVAAGFYVSNEQHTDLVDFLYGEYFNGAVPTQTQSQPYVADLNSGQTDTQVELAIIDSPDYSNTPPVPAAGTTGVALYPH